MVIIRELKTRLREALGAEWKNATAEEVAHLALVELAGFYRSAHPTADLLDQLVLVQTAAVRALQTLQIGQPEASEEQFIARLQHDLVVKGLSFDGRSEGHLEVPSRETEAIASAFLEEIRNRAAEVTAEGQLEMPIKAEQ